MPHPPNRLCGTEELLWPWPQALHVWDMSWPSDLQKTLHLQEPDLKWESHCFLFTSSHSRVGPCLAWRKLGPLREEARSHTVARSTHPAEALGLPQHYTAASGSPSVEKNRDSVSCESLSPSSKGR